MKILSTVKKIPGGLMAIPLILGVIINTFFPGVLQIGSFTTDLWYGGAMPILAVFLFCNSAQINVKQAAAPLAKGVILTATELVIGIGIGLLVNKIFGPAGFWGLTPLALIAGISNSNGGLYAALAGEFGDASDVGAVSILSINDGPFFTMVALGASGIADIPVLMIVGAILPIIVGCILGNLDEDLRKWLEPGTVILIPFFAFPLGAKLTLMQLIQAGPSGILLGVMSCLLVGIPAYFIMKLIRAKRPEIGGAIGTTAGNAAAVPENLGAAGVVTAAVAATATAQVAAAVIVTAILCPILVSVLSKIESKKRGEKSIDMKSEEFKEAANLSV
ncbi:MAG: 2-keto-3-deoxygluconate permease [Oscillospiraceae bacterium]